MSTPTPTYAMARFIVTRDDADAFMDTWVDQAKDDRQQFPSAEADAWHDQCIKTVDAMYTLANAWLDLAHLDDR